MGSACIYPSNYAERVHGRNSLPILAVQNLNRILHLFLIGFSLDCCVLYIFLPDLFRIYPAGLLELDMMIDPDFHALASHWGWEGRGGGSCLT